MMGPDWHEKYENWVPCEHYKRVLLATCRSPRSSQPGLCADATLSWKSGGKVLRGTAVSRGLGCLCHAGTNMWTVKLPTSFYHCEGRQSKMKDPNFQSNTLRWLGVQENGVTKRLTVGTWTASLRMWWWQHLESGGGVLNVLTADEMLMTYKTLTFWMWSLIPSAQ